MKRVVVDASLAMRWLVPADDSSHARAVVADAAVALHAPELIWSEVANALWKYGRAGADAERLLNRLQDFRSLPLKIASTDDLVSDALALALELGHPVYDCVYVALAVRLSTSVVTADARMFAALEESPYSTHVLWHEAYPHHRSASSGEPHDADA